MRSLRKSLKKSRKLSRKLSRRNSKKVTRRVSKKRIKRRISHQDPYTFRKENKKSFLEQRDKRVLNIKEIQKFKDQLLDEIQDTFSDKKNPTLLEYQQQTENLITLKELLEREKESMPQENFDLISGQDFVILQIERWIDENNEIIDGWFEESQKPLKKH